MIEDKNVVPKNADVEARLVSAKSAGHFTGSSSLALAVTKIKVGGGTYAVQTGEVTKRGASRGMRTAWVVGGGTTAGALIGGVAGGGKGAAIGARGRSGCRSRSPGADQESANSNTVGNRFGLSANGAKPSHPMATPR